METFVGAECGSIYRSEIWTMTVENIQRIPDEDDERKNEFNA